MKLDYKRMKNVSRKGWMAFIIILSTLVATCVIIKAPVGILSALVATRVVITAAIFINPSLVAPRVIIVPSCCSVLFGRGSPDI